ncbi:hypothetical protein AGMMS49982_23720 [Bacteroidia bacterium]|nr:hypothetical protein AGMMS49982_23720 [Bacteroidia bacterium]
MNMKKNNFILIAAVMCSVTACYVQGEKKVTDKTFQTFLDKFKTVKLPINHKKLNLLCPYMTEKEAILFLNKKKPDFFTIRTVLGEDENGNEVIDEETDYTLPGCDFKYQLNDTILILCTRDGIYGGEKDTALVYLNSFTLQGKLIDRCIVGGNIYYYESPASENNSDFILFDKHTIRLFYYDEIYSKRKEDFLSTVYYVNYEITSEGKFIKKEKSDVTFLKQHADFYSEYNSKMVDDPMNEYDF